jgi:hypothetical protein
VWCGAEERECEYKGRDEKEKENEIERKLVNERISQ